MPNPRNRSQESSDDTTRPLDVADQRHINRGLHWDTALAATAAVAGIPAIHAAITSMNEDVQTGVISVLAATAASIGISVSTLFKRASSGDIVSRHLLGTQQFFNNGVFATLPFAGEYAYFPTENQVTDTPLDADDERALKVEMTQVSWKSIPIPQEEFVLEEDATHLLSLEDATDDNHEDATAEQDDEPDSSKVPRVKSERTWHDLSDDEQKALLEQWQKKKDAYSPDETEDKDGTLNPIQRIDPAEGRVEILRTGETLPVVVHVQVQWTLDYSNPRVLDMYANHFRMDRDEVERRRTGDQSDHHKTNDPGIYFVEGRMLPALTQLVEEQLQDLPVSHLQDRIRGANEKARQRIKESDMQALFKEVGVIVHSVSIVEGDDAKKMKQDGLADDAEQTALGYFEKVHTVAAAKNAAEASIVASEQERAAAKVRIETTRQTDVQQKQADEAVAVQDKQTQTALFEAKQVEVQVALELEKAHRELLADAEMQHAEMWRILAETFGDKLSGDEITQVVDSITNMFVDRGVHAKGDLITVGESGDNGGGLPTAAVAALIHKFLNGGGTEPEATREPVVQPASPTQSGEAGRAPADRPPVESVI